MFGREIKIFKIRNIQIALDISWFWIFALVLVSFYLSTSNLPLIWDERLSLALIASGLFFASILFHELAHTFVANRYEQNISKITLFIFGGVSNLSKEPDTPKIEFTMALAGPLSSVLLGAVFFMLSNFFRSDLPMVWLFFNLAYFNFLLAVFNIVPAYPLDGGRIFRAIVWRRTKDIDRATEIAVDLSRTFALFIIILGAMQTLLLSTFSGIWLVFIGLFIYRMASASRTQSKVMRLLQKIKVIDILRQYPFLDLTKGSITVAISKVKNGLFEYLIISKSGKTIGVLPAQYLSKEKAFSKEIIKLSTISSVRPEMSLATAFNQIIKNKQPVLVVKRKTGFMGIITLDEIIRTIENSF